MNGRLDAEQMAARHEAAQEIARLRLTDAEREAVALVANLAESVTDAGCWQIAATLRGLLVRLG